MAIRPISSRSFATPSFVRAGLLCGAANDAEATINGGGIALGGGFDYFFSPHFSLGADITHNIIEYNEVEFRLGDSAISTEIDEEGAMTSLGLSLTYYF